MTPREISMEQLTTEMTDFLGLPQDLDLPPLHSIECRRTATSGWSVRAHLAYRGSGQGAVDAIAAWAAYTGGRVETGLPYLSPTQPSGMQRTLSLRVVIAQIPVELYACVDAFWQAPAGSGAPR